MSHLRLRVNRNFVTMNRSTSKSISIFFGTCGLLGAGLLGSGLLGAGLLGAGLALVDLSLAQEDSTIPARGSLSAGSGIVDSATIGADVETRGAVQESSGQPLVDKREAANQLPAQDEPSSIPQNQQNVTIRFAFQNAKWSTVIDWFAEQIDLIPYTDYSDYPAGTFSNADGRDYSVKEALDQLNFYLALEGYTLVRFGNRLIVIDHQTKGLPADLIPMVAAAELDDRGEYEVVYSKFDISGLDYDMIERQVRQVVKEPRGEVRVLAVSEQLYVRETAKQLRLIRSMVEKAQSDSVIVYRARTLEHIPFPQLMQFLRPQFGMRENENRLGDGSLAISLLNSETRPWISGTRDKVEKTMKLIDELDVPENRPTGMEVEGYLIKYYSPKTDPEIIEKVLLEFFTGRGDIRMTRSPDSDTIYVKARPRDHIEIEDLIGKLESNAIVFERIPTYKLLPSEMVLKLKQALGMSPSLFEEDTSGKNKNLIFMEDFDSVFVRGTQRLINEIKSIADKLDPPPSEGQGVARLPYRTLPIDEGNLADILDIFEGVWEVSGRPAELQMRMPSDRRGDLNASGSRRGSNTGIRFPSYDRRFGAGEFDKLDPASLSPEQMSQLMQLLQLMEEQSKTKAAAEAKQRDAAGEGARGPRPEGAGPSNPPRSTNPIETRRSLSGRDYQVVTLGKGDRRSAEPAETVYAKTGGQDEWQDDELPPARPSAAPEVSVPGDPVVIEMSPNGLMLRSRDLDALDLAERLLRDLSRNSLPVISTAPAKTVFLLGFRSASEVASEIEEILGIGGGGGGGGGGMGDLLGNMAQNALGGAAGGMVGALMGGGGGGSSSSAKTTGDVSIHVDNFLNAMIVYANETDTEEIDQLIELKDRPSTPHDPRIYGTTRSIKIKHRDPQAIKEQIDLHFASVLRKAEGQGGGGGGGGQQPNPEAIIRAMMGGRGGRGGGGGGGGSSEAAKPQITVSVDIEAKLLLVKGPENYLDEVEQMVKELDYEGAVPVKRIELIQLPPGVTADQVTKVMQDLFSAGTHQQRPGQQPGQQGQQGQRPGGQQGGGNQDAMRAIQDAMRQQMGGQGGRGGQGGGFGGQGGGRGGQGGGFGGQGGGRGTQGGGQGGGGRGGQGGGGQGGGGRGR